MEISSPKDKLLGKLKANGISDSDSENFINVLFLYRDGKNQVDELINIHGLERAIEYVVINMAEFASYRGFFAHQPKFNIIFNCFGILQTDDLLSARRFNFSDSKKAAKGYIVDFPILCGLSFRAPSREFSNIYKFLQVSSFCAAFSALVSGSKSYNAMILTLRMLRTANEEANFKLLNSLGGEFGRASYSFSGAMPSLLEDLISDLLVDGKYSEVKQLASLNTVLEHIAKGKSLPVEHQISQSKKTESTYRKIKSKQGAVEPGVDTPIEIWEKDVLYENELATFVNDDGGAYGEMSSPTRLIKAPLTRRQKRLTSTKQIVYQMQGFRNSEIKRNQNLPFQENQLKRAELAVFLKELSKYIKNELESDHQEKSEEEKLDGWILLFLMLIMGKAPEQLDKIVRFNHPESGEGLLGRKINCKYELLISFIAPKHQIQNRKITRTSSLNYPVDSELINICLKDEVAQYAKALFKAKKNFGLKLNTPIFSRSMEDVKAEAVKIIRHLNRKNNTDISSFKLRNWLSQVIEQETGDSALSFYMLGESDDVKPPEAFYSAYDRSKFQALYDFLFSEKYFNQEIFTFKSSELTDVVGSKLFTRVDKLALASGRLHTRLSQFEAEDLDGIIDFHNEYVNYIFLMFCFGSALRSVCDPLESIQSFDLKSGLFVLNEKHARSETNLRYLFLPDLLSEQLNAYLAHLQELSNRVATKGLELAKITKAAISGANYHSEKIPLLFYIRKDKPSKGLFKRSSYIYSLEPNKISSSLKNIFPIPLNQGRHFLRSELILKGCPAYWINYLMGHAEPGLEGGSQYSSLAFQSLLDLKNDYLNPIVTKSGWKVHFGLVNS